MDEMQRRFREQLDEVKRNWQPKLGLGGLVPKYTFSRLAAVPRRTREVVAGRHASRVETLYQHLHDEIVELNAGLAADEDAVLLLLTGHGDPIQVGGISYRNPDLLICDGLNDANQRVRVLAQAGAVQLVMTIVKSEPDTPRPTQDFAFGGEKITAAPGA